VRSDVSIKVRGQTENPGIGAQFEAFLPQNACRYWALVVPSQFL
jgi:hypothetical protein